MLCKEIDVGMCGEIVYIENSSQTSTWEVEEEDQEFKARSSCVLSLKLSQITWDLCYCLLHVDSSQRKKTAHGILVIGSFETSHFKVLLFGFQKPEPRELVW